MNRTRVLLLFGGESSEHAVSVSSARNVYGAIDDSKYEVLLGYIDENGRWWLLENFDAQIDTHGALQLLPALSDKSFVTVPSSKIITPDVILPILHGKNGEDGSVQGLAQLLHIPIVGCDMTSSAICMDKLATKEILSAHDIKVAPYKVHRKFEQLPKYSELNMTLGSPLFVKPARAGSSVGVSKVANEEELLVALGTAHKHDDIVLIESSIAGREIELSVLGTPPHHQVSAPGEVVPGAEFYSYEDKYDSSSHSSVVIPADIGKSLTDQIQNLAGQIYTILGCSGLARVDFFLTDDGTIYLNEVNTLPGFTNISMYPKSWRYQGISDAELIERLLDDALQRATIEAEN